ncbi:Hypothetical protein, putative [Bodo saltans]|uniref:Uncharacterized protein n=1 Tax=Bodo saltans TaxID=75058 RepID=A0A0S4ISE0_BODSA|nr:Hypothetical protein, putative [Bodo saltans]|eukprot:CUF61369.1 Hypothetical protein, putative [Bodo saltans]
MDSAHLALVRNASSATRSTPSKKESSAVTTSPKPLDQPVKVADEPPVIQLAQAPHPVPPPPIPAAVDASPTMEVLMADINRCLHGIDVTSNLIGTKFTGLMSSSQEYLESVAVATGDHCDLMLQATNFLDFQSETVCRSGMTMLSKMKDLHRDMAKAKELLADIQQANAAMVHIEEVLVDLEKERGIVVPPVVAHR